MFEDNIHSLGFASPPAARRGAPDPLRELRQLLFGDDAALHELPALPDLIGAALALASGTRRKVILPLTEAPAEVALVRRGEHVVVDCYGTESTPEIYLRERAVALRDLLATCSTAGHRLAQQSAEPTGATALKQLSRKLAEAVVVPELHPRSQPVRCSGGSLESPGASVPLAFGFHADIVASTDAAPESHAFADVHALLFHGSLWAFAGNKRIAVVEGPIALAAQCMVAAVRLLCDAWQADRSLNRRLQSGGFRVTVKRERGGNVALTFHVGRGEALTLPALDVHTAALPILRLCSDLLRKLITTDRRQSHNLRVLALRNEVRALRRIIRARGRRESFENADPERLRLSTSISPANTQPSPSLHPVGLRYTQRWSIEVDGLDAGAVYLCGERLVIATQKLTLGLSRANGEVLWSQPSAGAVPMMAGGRLLRLLPDGGLELHEVEHGSVYAHAQLGARAGSEGPGLFVGGGSLPPMAILIEARQHLCAIDLRTGQPRWRFRAHGPDGLQLARSGRVLCVISGDGTVDALDVATGEVAWRFGDGVRFCLTPAICRDVLVAVAGEPRGGAGAAYGIDLYSGKLLWQRELPAAPSSEPLDASGVAIIPYGRSRQAHLLALDPRTGEALWDQPDPGLDNGGRALCLDGSLIVNTPSGRVRALDLETGQTRWQRALSNPLTDDVPRQLEPVLRQGALFVPSAQVHLLRPQDGTPLCELACDLVPDALRVDERSSFYVAEESGHLCAYAAAPHLSLVR
jgi:outer membrane protein assembly factor BamB